MLIEPTLLNPIVPPTFYFSNLVIKKIAFGMFFVRSFGLSLHAIVTLYGSTYSFSFFLASCHIALLYTMGPAGISDFWSADFWVSHRAWSSHSEKR